MDEINDVIKRINVGTLTGTELTLLDYTNGAVVKTIMLGNSTSIDQVLSLDVDGAIFLYTIPSKSTLTITDYFICNILKGKLITEEQADEESNPITNTISFHISGIQLGNS